ncbi:unnamed protein product [Laminaria digitata]
MGRDVRLRVSILVVLEDPVTEIQHVLRLEALLLTFPEDMPLSGVEREAGAAVKSSVQCVLKGTANDVSLRASRKREPHLLNFVAADEEIIEIAAPDADRDGGNPHLWSTLPVPIVEDQVTWDESIEFPLGRQVKRTYMPHTKTYPRQLYGKGKERSVCQVSFIVTFFVVEAQTQMSTALGFAVLEIPDDVRLDDGVAELSADLTSPDGKPLEDVVCVVDLKATGPPPLSARETSSSEEDEVGIHYTVELRRQSDSVLTQDDERQLAAKKGSKSQISTSEATQESMTNAKDKERLQALDNEVESLQGQLEAVHAEADQKQAMVAHLSEQVDKRSDAIRKCGAEIVKLRKHIEVTEQERRRLDSQLKALHMSTAGAEMEVNRIMKAMAEGDASVHGFDGDAGGRHTRALAKRCIFLTEENKTLHRVAQDSAHERWQAAALQARRMEKMKKTQHVQAVYIRKMQALPGKVSAYKSTVKMQEKVIAKLEALLSGRQPPSTGNTEVTTIAGSVEDGAGGRLKFPASDDQRRGREVDKLRKENAKLRWRLAMAGSTKRNDVPGHMTDDVGVLLEMKDSKIRILEEQMVANAKAAGDEIATLKMRIMEMEIGTAVAMPGHP